MNRTIKLAWMGAIALAGLGFSACSSDDIEENPNYNPVTKEVNANFVFSVSTSNTPTSRQSADNVQNSLTNPFRGIDNANLFAYKLGTTNDGQHLAAAATAEKVYELGTILGPGSLDNTTKTTQEASHRVVEIALPTETNALLFWGKAIKDGQDDQEGSISFVVNKDISQNTFSLKPRIASDKQMAYKAYQKFITTILTRIVQNGFNGSSPEKVNTTETPITYSDVTVSPALDWSDYVDMTGATMVPKTKSPYNSAKDITPLEEILADAYIAFNTLYTDEIRAGSGEAIARSVGDLWSVIAKVATAEPTSMEEAVAQAMAERIRTRLSNYFTEAGPNCKWASTSTVATNLKKNLNETASGTFDTDYAAVIADLNTFPQSIFNVPAGATQLSYDKANRKYSYTEDLPMTGMGGTTTTAYDYMYPAELCYFGNSPIRVTNDSHVTADYPDGVANWDDDTQWAAGVHNNNVAWTKNGHVLSTTRSVAMQNNINYGTALLETTVRYGAPTLYDNNKKIQQDRYGTVEDNAEILASADAFTLTGIVIGGQEQDMAWNYIAKDASPKFNKMIYDKDIPSQAIPAYSSAGAPSQPNYTLVWDNWNEAQKDNKQNDVYIALEFKNNTGRDFWGQSNLIRNGGTFYIIGKLNPDKDGLSTTDYSEGIAWPDANLYALPPYASDGSTIKQRRIFIQDYKTTANFVIGANSLQHAYVTVPDLRSTQISLGLSVDVNWQTGLTFDDVVLGN